MSCSPIALSVRYCKQRVGVSRLSALHMFGRVLVSPFCALGLVPQCPSNFWMADGTHHSHNLFFTFPHGGCTNGHQLLLFIDLQSFATCPNEMYLLFRQGILPLVQSIMHSGRFTSHGLFARGTHLECSMGLLYQLIGVHRGGGFQSPSCALFSFPPKFGLIFTSCQSSHSSSVSSPFATVPHPHLCIPSHTLLFFDDVRYSVHLLLHLHSK
jgi:hypothetical protein